MIVPEWPLAAFQDLMLQFKDSSCDCAAEVVAYEEAQHSSRMLFMREQSAFTVNIALADDWKHLSVTEVENI